MLSMFPRTLLKGFVAASLAIPATSIVALSASPAFADESVAIMEKPFRAKRTNGRDSEANQGTGAPQDRVARSNGRARDNGPSVTHDADEEGPVALEFARETSTSTRSAGSNGRGRNTNAVSDELPGFDVADAAPEALENPAPGTMSEQLASYRNKRLALLRAADHHDNAYENYVYLRDLDAATIAAKFPNGDYADALATAKDTFMTLRDAVARRQDETKGELFEIAGGRELPVDAVRALNSLLGV